MGVLPGSGSPQDKYKVTGEAFTEGKIYLLGKTVSTRLCVL